MKIVSPQLLRIKVCVWAILGLAPCSIAAAGNGSCGIWDVIPTPNSANATQSVIRDVAAITPTDVWAVGGFTITNGGSSPTYAFALHWNGSTWVEIPTPQPTSCPTCTHVTLWAVDALGPNDVWACGEKFVQGPGGSPGTHILVMHWNGSSWTAMNTPIQAAAGDVLYGVEAIAPNDVWFFGDYIYQGPTTSDRAIALHYDGSNFTFVPVPSVNPQTSGFGDGNGLRAGFALASNDIWAVGAASDGDSMPAGHSQIQHWNGSTWQNVPGPTPGDFHDLNAVVALAPNDVWAGGEYVGASGNHGLALHYNGSSWTQVPVAAGIQDFVAFASDDIYAAGGAIMHWDGASWSVVETFPQVVGATETGLSAAGPCDLWTGGRQLINDMVFNFSAHLRPAGTGNAGDLDADGDVDQADLPLFINVLLGIDTDSGHVSRSDMNGDTQVNGRDIGGLVAELTNG